MNREPHTSFSQWRTSILSLRVPNLCLQMLGLAEKDHATASLSPSKLHGFSCAMLFMKRRDGNFKHCSGSSESYFLSHLRNSVILTGFGEAAPLTNQSRHKIGQMLFSDGVTSADSARQEREVLDEYIQKWRARDANMTEEINNVLSSCDGTCIDICLEDIGLAASTIKRPSKVDCYGLCPLAISMFAEVRPTFV